MSRLGLRACLEIETELNVNLRPLRTFKYGFLDCTTDYGSGNEKSYVGFLNSGVP